MLINKYACSDDCLSVFRHPDIVTSVQFHPFHDSIFISGCLDHRIRVWDILPEPGSVRHYEQRQDKITSGNAFLNEQLFCYFVLLVAFSPDGKVVAIGLVQGQIFFYEYDSSTSTLQYLTLIECRNRQGTYHEGRKITSMQFLKSQSSSKISNRVLKSHEELSLLVTTNDNRIRLFSLADYSLVMKYKCPYYLNNSMLIRASLSEDCQYVISGNMCD